MELTMLDKLTNIHDVNLTAVIEAGLYAAGRPLDIDLILSLAGIRSKIEARRIIKLLKKRYDDSGSALQIIELNDGRYLMQLRSEYIPKIRKIVKRKLLSKGPLRTLAFIAYKQPVTQAYVSKVRGKLAYKHIRKIVDMGLISQEKLGNTKVLRTTETFADYFNLSHNMSAMKQQLKRLFTEIDGNILPTDITEDLYQEPSSPL
jgi:segregation and condensation protein B